MTQHSAHLGALRHIALRITGDGHLVNEHRVLVNKIDTAAATLVQLHDQPDPMLSSLAINLRIEGARGELKTLVGAAKERSSALIAAERFNVERNRESKGNLTPNAFAAEIRAVVRGLDTAGKLQILNDAVESGDGSTIAALCDCPAVVSGITATLAADYRRMYLQKAVPLADGYIGETEDAIKGVLEAADGLLT
jgi:hypothetical protein